ncbi:MAG: DNA mismatch repair protein MutS [Nitrospinota bacterium]
MTSQTPAMRQYLEIKKKQPDCVLFFRMGDFYEMFFEDAKAASKILNIALTSRGKSGDGKIPMCGIPYHALETYLARMVKSGQKVAICEQMEDPKSAKGVVKREVVRVVTPGTLTEDYLLDEKEANLLVSISTGGGLLGLASADLSTGSFTAREFSGGRAVELLIDELERLRPKEIIVPDTLKEDGSVIAELDASGRRYEKLEFLAFETEEARRRLNEQFGVATLEGFGIDDRTRAISAAGAVIYYVKQNSPSSLGAIKSVRWESSGGEMVIDAASLNNLEIISNSSGGGREGTLLEILDKTQTAMGARLMRQWIVKPLVKAEAVMKRQELVTAFFEDPSVCGGLRLLLRELGDFERCAGRIAANSFNPRDFSSLTGALGALPGIRASIHGLKESAQIAEIIAAWDSLEELYELLERAVSENHPATFRDGGFIRKGYDRELDELRSYCDNSMEAIKDIETRERESCSIPSLKIGYNKIYGYYIEVTKRHAEKIPASYIRKQSLVNTERYVSPELKELEEKLATAQQRAGELEDRLTQELRKKTLVYYERILAAAHLVARLDVSSSLAETARIYDYCAPEITEDDRLVLAESRHPVLERLMIEESFVPNDVIMEEGSERFLIVTGPNMAGKSTYLRQVALAVLMAQMGGYVAAKSAAIGVADRIFTRVGAQDRLQKGLSTFMVEMVETANILNNASQRSVIILDEIGRGTSTFDGVSIAWAVAEYLSRLNARTLFATHYHEITDLAATQPGVANFNVTAKEYHDRLIFMRRLEPGPADKSYGIQVARLAGIPTEVLARARSVLQKLEKMEFEADGKPALRAEKREPKKEEQVSFFDVGNHPALNSLREADIDKMTPLEALNLLQKLKELI